MKPALLIIDMQGRFFQDQDAAASLHRAVEYINAAVELFRAKDLPIIAIQHLDEAESLRPGEPDFEMPGEINLLPSDLRLTKTYSNAFTKTPLLERLKEMGVDTPILTGYCAEYCVLSTYRGARDLDLAPVILLGSLASGSAEHLHFVEEISECISYGALRAFLA